MTQEQFQALLKRYRQGKCSPQEEKFVNRWYASIKNKDGQSLNSSDERDLKNRYWRNVNDHIQKTKPKTSLAKMAVLLSWPGMSIAASILVAIAAFIYIQPSTKSNAVIAISGSYKKSEMKLVTNTGIEATNIKLPDGSKIILSPGGKINFIESFNTIEREIYLEGEAYFEVAHDATRPFLVYTKEVTTKVLGTSFTIRALPEDKHITVAVKTGKVSVYTHQDKSKLQSKLSETILTPNQQIVYNRNENKIARMLVSIPQALIPVDEIKRMRFEEASVGEIFTTLEEIYGVDIVFDEKLFATCTLRTSISDGTIYNRLDIICKAISATYKVEETQIVISGLGCN